MSWPDSPLIGATRAGQGDAREDRNVENPDRDDRIGGRGAEDRGDQDRDHERGKSEDKVIAAHHHFVEEASAVGRGQHLHPGRRAELDDASGDACHRRHGPGGHLALQIGEIAHVLDQQGVTAVGQ